MSQKKINNQQARGTLPNTISQQGNKLKTVRYYYTPTKLAIMAKCFGDKFSCIAGGNAKMDNHFGKQFDNFL